MSGSPKVHRLLDPLISRFITSDENASELLRKIVAVVEEQQSLYSTSVTALSEVLSQFSVSALDLLNYSDSRDTSRCKIAGLIVFDCLLDVTDDIRPERRFEIANHLCKVLETDKPSLVIMEDVLTQAASSVGHFVQLASRTETDHFGGVAYQLSLKLIGNSRSEANRFAGVLILNQLSLNAPAFIFMRRDQTFKELWNLVSDKCEKVRNAAAVSLEAALQVVAQREAIVEYLQEALNQIHTGFAANTLEKNLSSMLILDIIVTGVVNSVDLQNIIVSREGLAEDLIWKVLQRKEFKDAAVRQKVIEIVPNLADAFSSAFVNQNPFTGNENFLTYCLKFLMTSIQAKRHRAVAFTALGKLCFNMSNQLRTSSSLMEDIVTVICGGFSKPFCVEALQSLGMIVNSCVNMRKLVDDQLIDATFRGGLTPELVECLKILTKHVPSSVRSNVHTLLRFNISKILRKYSVLIDEVAGQSTGHLRLAKGRGGGVGAGVAGGGSGAAASTQTGATTASTQPTARESITITSRRWGAGTSLFGSSTVKQPPSPGPPSVEGAADGAGSSRQGDGAGGMSASWKAEDELVFALDILTMTEFFPKMHRDRDRKSAHGGGGARLMLRTSRSSRHAAAGGEEDQSIDLLNIARHAVVVYLDDCDPKVRTAAAVACAAVIDSSIMAVDPSQIEFQYLLQILDRLMIMGVGDDVQDIRVRVFDSIPPDVDHVIPFTENMHCLIEALNDEQLDVRIAAMNVISRVAHYDTLHVMPVMRLTMKRLILTLINSKDPYVKRESVQMLQALVNGSHSLIVPYVKQIIEPLMYLLSNSEVDVVAALSAIGDLAVASPESVREYLDQFSPMLIEALNDQASVSKQETAVIAMGKLVSSLTIEVAEEPYKKYEGLFEGLVRAIQSKEDSSSELRLQAIRTVGLLGIVDVKAYQRHLINQSPDDIMEESMVDSGYQRQQEEYDSDNDNDEVYMIENAGEDKDVPKRLSAVQKSYFTAVVKELIKILRDDSLPQFQLAAASAGVRVLRIVGAMAAQAPLQVKGIMQGLFYRIYHKETTLNHRETLLDHIITVISLVGPVILQSEILDTIIKLIHDTLDAHLQTCLNIIEALSITISTPHFYLVLRATLPVLIRTMNDESVSSTMSMTHSNSSDPDDATSITATMFRVGSAPSSSFSSSAGANANTSVGDRARNGSNPFSRTMRILRVLNNIAGQLGEYRRDLVSVVIRILDAENLAPVDVRKEALCTVMHLTNNTDLLEFASRIIHPLLRLVDRAEIEMQTVIVTALSCMICRLGRGFVPYIIPVRRKMRFIALRHSGSDGRANRLVDEYETLVSRLLKQRPLPPEPAQVAEVTPQFDKTIRRRCRATQNISDSISEFDLASLETAWTLKDRRKSATDLTFWMNRLSVELIRQAPSSIIRACSGLATSYRPLAQGLFNVAFHCVWEELYASDVYELSEDIPLITSLENALQSPQSSQKNVIVPLLKLAEFMDMRDRHLSIDVRLLSHQAKEANMFAKTLYNREIEFRSKNVPPSIDCIDSLISVNNQLGLSDNAVGMLQHLKTHFPHIAIQSSWLEKLSRWNDAQKSYEEDSRFCYEEFDRGTGAEGRTFIARNSAWMTSALGKMRCLHALGEYEQLEEIAKQMKEKIKATEDVEVDEYNPWSHLNEVQRLGANASWMLGKWTVMEEFLEDEHHDDDDQDTLDVVLDQNISFYRAIVAIHKHDYDRAESLIEDTRGKLAGSIGSLLSEKYSRAYRAMVTMQVLAEMEEVVDYRRSVDKTLSDMEAIKNSASSGGTTGSASPATTNTTTTAHNNDTTGKLNVGVNGGGGNFHAFDMGGDSPTRGFQNTIANSGSIVAEKILSPSVILPGGAGLSPGTNSEQIASGLVDLEAKKYNLIVKWRGRLESAPPDIDSLRQILSVHTLVTEPAEDLDSWLELVTLCRKERMDSLCENILRKLGAPLTQRKVSGGIDAGIEAADDTCSIEYLRSDRGGMNDRVLLSTFEYLWSIGEKTRALEELSAYLRVNAGGAPNRLSTQVRRFSTNEATMFRVECLLKRADWIRELNEGGEGNVADTREIFATLMRARDLAGDRYSVWHAWAVANYDYLKKATTTTSSTSSSSSSSSSTLNAATTSSSSSSSSGEATPPVGLVKVLATAASHHLAAAGDEKVSGKATIASPRKGVSSATKAKRKLSSSSGSASLLNILSSQQVDSVTPYIIEAIRGFVKSIILGDGQPVADVLQDTLRLITLWFSYGTKKGVYHILEAELDKISPDMWLAVIPQLIARIHIKSPEISGMLRKLLNKVATAHPQALVCPISVALNTYDVQQSRVSTEVLFEMRKSRSQLVEEATMMSVELMRVAITPHELWYDGLEQAAQLYMDNKDIPGMMSVLTDLHEAMNDTATTGAYSMTGATTAGSSGVASFNAPVSSSSTSSSPYASSSAGTFDQTSGGGPPAAAVDNVTNGFAQNASKPSEGFAEGIGKIGRSTLRDISFRHCYSKQLGEAHQWLERFRTTGATTDLHQAWEIYQLVFKKIKVQITSLKKLELHHVSPALTNAVDLSLVIPGTYKPSTPDIGIKRFSHFISVIASKQRPRRISMLGSNGIRYEFLLKGHEDLRQDERVMQLFGLINACLNNDNITNNRGLEIVRYSVLPLSNNSGVIGWVQNCDTLNQLVKQYRESKDMRLLIEVKLLHSKCLNYDKLPLMHKVDIFRQVLEETSGRDLAKMLWLKSKTADAWVERRANFTKSMAVMSMAGYILGLGDRHPSNLMLDRITGRVVHIDFGDCFEITKHRSKYPEIIPFRLTRMLTNCMGPAGIQGSYRLTCERVMSVLRENRDSVMAMLEAFVYDPLISWRLLANRIATDNALPSGTSRAVNAIVGGDDEQEDFIPGAGGGAGGELGGPSGIPGHSMEQLLEHLEAAGGGANSLLKGGSGAAESIKNIAQSLLQTRNQSVREMKQIMNLAPTAPLKSAEAESTIGEDGEPLQENLNARALEVINRIQAKLTGRDFTTSDDSEDLTIQEQVERLILEATSVENLCQLFAGWCPLW